MTSHVVWSATVIWNDANDVLTLSMADGTGRVRVGGAVPVIVDPASRILRRQPYLEAYHAWKTGKDVAAKPAPARPKK